MEFNRSIIEIIKSRYSCRSYDGKPLDGEAEKKLSDYIDEINQETEIKARFIYIANRPDCGAPAKLGTYGMISGAVSFIAGICDVDEKDFAQFGYLFEKIILFATALNVQTCWLGGTFNKNDFIQTIGLNDSEYIAVASPVGVKKQKPRLFDNAVRTVTGANNRKPFAELFFEDNLSVPMNMSSAGSYIMPLETVRLAPSGSNKQPWKTIKNKDGYHFYLKRTKGYPAIRFDIQKNDIGIAMCHFELTAKELKLKGRWSNIKNPPDIDGLEYISTWVTGE
ncbi:MAG: nitroreductase family protein [Eubacteriales bacterium]